MKKLIVFSVFLLLTIGIFGCTDDTLQDPKFIETSPTKIGKAYPSLNVYGKLIGYSENGQTGYFKIETEMINCEDNLTILEVGSNVSKFQNTLVSNDAYMKCRPLTYIPQSFYESFNLTYEELEIGERYMFPQSQEDHFLCGEVLDFDESPFSGPSYHFDDPTANVYIQMSTAGGYAKLDRFPPEPEEGGIYPSFNGAIPEFELSYLNDKTVFLAFHKIEEEGIWILREIYENENMFDSRCSSSIEPHYNY